MDDGLGEDLNAAAKGSAGEEHGSSLLDTSSGKEGPPSEKSTSDSQSITESDDFDRDRIFNAVIAGDPELLNGLRAYLQKKSYCLSDSRYTDGKTGKTCLMKALLHLKDGQNPTIRLLLDIDRETRSFKPRLINAACSNSYYKGQTALHIAIEKRNLELVTLLMDYEADVHVKASGLFFQHHHKGACFYFGELPLSLAACTNQPEVVTCLLSKARLTERDSLGNTVLHALVMVADNTEKNTEFVINMYDMILKKGAEITPSDNLEEILNREQLNPLKLAAKTGKFEILRHILHREIEGPGSQHLTRKFTEWTYGPIHISLYDLTSIDSCEKNSVLEILAYNDTPNRYKMVGLEPLKQLLQHKWESFVRKRFFSSLFLYLVFMVVFTVTAYYQQRKVEPLVTTAMIIKDLLKRVGPVFVFIGGVYLLVAQMVYFWRRHFSLKSLLVDSCFEIFFLVQAVAILASSVMYFAKVDEYELPMVFALLLGWVNILYYTRGLQQMGIYIMMIQKAIFRNLLHFLMVYVIFLFGFATALIILTGDASHSSDNESLPLRDDAKEQVVYSGLLRTSLQLFRFTIGMSDLEYNENLKHSYVVMLLVLLFLILTYILLLNMLIALMSETVTEVSKDSQSVWQLQRAIAILEIEKNWIWFWKKAERAGCQFTIGPEKKKDKRWFFRVIELDWEVWNKKLFALSEDSAESSLVDQLPAKRSKIRSFLAQKMRHQPSQVKQEEEMEERVPLQNLAP